MSLQLILISLRFYPLVLPCFAMSPSPTHVMYPFARFPFARFLEDIVQVKLPMTQIYTCEFTHMNSCVINQLIRVRTYDLVLLLFITFWKNVLLTSTWILGPAYTFVHRWLIMANLILPNMENNVGNVV